jgi:restriction endonuclease
MLTLRYSATHKSDSIYNMVYRLDAMEAYNKRLVKKIAVKGISESGTTATDSYVYLESINLSKRIMKPMQTHPLCYCSLRRPVQFLELDGLFKYV